MFHLNMMELQSLRKNKNKYFALSKLSNSRENFHENPENFLQFFRNIFSISQNVTLKGFGFPVEAVLKLYVVMVLAKLSSVPLVEN